MVAPVVAGLVFAAGMKQLDPFMDHHTVIPIVLHTSAIAKG